jgi:hypothetical protein
MTNPIVRAFFRGLNRARRDTSKAIGEDKAALGVLKAAREKAIEKATRMPADLTPPHRFVNPGAAHDVGDASNSTRGTR